MKRESFENVGIDDKIIYTEGRYYYRREVLASVTKVTPKRFIDNYGNTFRKEDGRNIGDWFYCQYATDEDVRRVTEQNRRKLLCSQILLIINRSAIEKFSTAELESIYEITHKYEDKQR